ncbi:MAG TPA: YdeI/OmpD-associated family protein [Candidatus Sulfotelmatobacter sp.]|nr:YdeI/OmpD-associated family protein [Candidatus Sulfotelmatobacter sp.]
MKTKPKAIGKSFKATLERMQPSSLGWVIIRIPFDVSKLWGVRGRLRVKGEINGFPFRTALFPTGKGYHFLLFNKRMQAGAGVLPGGTAHFCLEPDLETRKAVVPVELKRFLSEDRALCRWFDNLSYSIRKYICDSITQPKSTDARLRRAEQIAERLLTAMEAERDLPPVLKAAFARDPRAYEGWQRMSPTQRRHHLLGIFYYRSPEARDRRIAKMLEEAAARASKVARTKLA